jgi:hypothetical protein
MGDLQKGLLIALVLFMVALFLVWFFLTSPAKI